MTNKDTKINIHQYLMTNKKPNKCTTISPDKQTNKYTTMSPVKQIYKKILQYLMRNKNTQTNIQHYLMTKKYKINIQ